MSESEELLKKAQQLIKEKKFQEAVDHLPDETIEAAEPESLRADLYAEKAKAFYKIEKYDLSKEGAEKALTINPEQVKALTAMGMYYNKSNEYDKSIEYFNKANKIAPENHLPHSLLGLIYYNQKQYNKTIEHFETARKLAPENIATYTNLGLVYSEIRKYDKAIDLCQEAIKIDHTNPSIYFSLGLIYQTQKEYYEAIENYEKVIDLDPEYTKAYYTLGLVYYKQGRYSKSLNYYEKYIHLTEKDPTFYTKIVQDKVKEIHEHQQTGSDEIAALVTQIKDLLEYNDGGVTHYTSLSAARALLLEASPMRLSEGAFLNDTSEGKELLEFLSIEPERPAKGAQAEPFARKPFIGSFVPGDKHDNLTLWRMYGKENKEEAMGCSITINAKRLIDAIEKKLLPEESFPEEKTSINPLRENFQFYRVAYREAKTDQSENETNTFKIPGASKEEEKKLNEQMKQLKEKIKEFEKKKKISITQNPTAMKWINEIAYLFKSEAYQHEHELRLIIDGVGFDKVIEGDASPPRVYIELVSLRPLAEKITIGPKVSRSDEWASAFYYSLREDDLEPPILISRLPYK